MKNSLLFLVLLSLLAACSGPGGKTSASLKVTFGGLSVGGSPVTQIIITGQSSKGEKFSRVLTDGTDVVSLPLPNGSWNFLAMSWEGVTPLDGKVRCAYSTVSLDGSPTDIPLVMTNAKCFDGTINVQTADTGGVDPAFRAVVMRACRIDIQSIASGTENCNFAMGTANPKGAVIGSLKVGVQGGDQFGGNFVHNNQFLGSGCENAGSYAAINQRFPNIKPAYFFPLVALGYPAAVCSPSKGVIRATISNNNLRMIDYGVSAAMFARFTDEQVCTAANANGATAINEIGMGMANAPYGICNLAQLRHWQENFASYASTNVALLTNLDLLPWVKAGTAGPTPYHACLKDGSTFMPLGASVDGSCNFNATVFFNGVFHGLNHSISHFRFESDENDMGLFRGFAGSGSIQSLKLISPSVRGANNVGAFVGNAGTGGALAWLKVENGDIEGDAYVGMIAGIATSGALKSGLHASGTVRAQGNYLGGLVGDANTDQISESSFAGEVTNESGNFVGGITGRAGTIDQVVVSGYVQGVNNVGGIAGQATSIQDARVTASVVGTIDMAGTVHGGIAGIASSVERAMFFGSFYSYASSGNVGIISSNAPGTNVDTYTSQLYTSVGTGSIANNSGTSASAIPVWTQVCDTATAWNCRDLNSDYVLDAGEGMDLPRLAFENHPCMQQANLDSVALQQAAGRGTSTNPIRVCRREQLDEINTDATTRSLHYSLEQDIAINHITSGIVANPNSFAGTFNGNGHALHGLTNLSAPANYGLFNSVSTGGVVRNLRLYNFNFASVSNGLSLVGNNFGLIENVQTKLIKLTAPGFVGGLIRSNQGTIRNVKVEATISSDTQTGGIAVTNTETIEDVISRVSMSAYDGTGSGGTDTNFGGIVGSNTGIIRRAQFDGSINSSFPTWDIKRVGGLVGTTAGGSITDSIVSGNAYLNLTSLITEAGTLIGHHDANGAGTLARLISQGLLKHENASLFATLYLGSNIGRVTGVYTIPTSLVTYTPILLSTADGAGNSGSFTFDGTSLCQSNTYAGTVLALPNPFSYITYAADNSLAPFFVYWDGVELSFSAQSAKECERVPANLDFYADGGFGHNPVTLADLRSVHGFNLVDYDFGTDAHKRPVFDAHLAAIRGQPAPSTKPVWIFEEGQYELFRTDK